MTELFADTGYWVDLQMAKDALHTIASHWSATVAANIPIITSDLVLIEYINYVSGFGPAYAGKLLVYATTSMQNQELLSFLPHREFYKLP
jgi:hypothetical protein